MADSLYNFIVENDDLQIKFSCANHTRRINDVVHILLDKDETRRESAPNVTCRYRAKTEKVSFTFNGVKNDESDIRY